MAMKVTLQQPAISASRKLYSILLVNGIVLGATFFGYKYLPSILALDPRPNVRLMVVVAMAPVLALCCSIVIGTKQPKTLTADDDGITLGDAIAGSEFYPWRDISGFSLNPNSKVLKFKVDSLQLKQTFRLKQFGISQQQFEQMQQLAVVGLKGE